MNRRSFVLFFVLFGMAALLTSCLFDSEESSFGGWLSDQGLPSSYKVQTLSVGDLAPLSAEAYTDTSLEILSSRGVLGATSNMSHDLVLDFSFWDTTFFADLNRLKSPKVNLILNLLTPFYTSKSFPADSLPIKETVSINVSWIIDAGSKKSFVDSVGEVTDSTWKKSLAKWSPKNSAEISADVNITKKDSTWAIELPSELLADLQKLKAACHLQLKLSAPEAPHLYRFYGPSVTKSPILKVTYEKDDPADIYPFRAANTLSNLETCTDCLVLHGGVVDSLVVEFPSKPILSALSDFYGDGFPNNATNGDDVRQAVVLAQLTFYRDDSQGSNELGHPIQVVVGSYVDSAGTTVRDMEAYKLNKKLIVSEGHPNMLFHEGDSLTLQVTYGIRDFINRASDGRTFKMMMRMGYPVLQEKDSTYANYKTASGDSSYVFFSHFDYARYDFSSMMQKPATLKLWLATKRGDEE